MALHRKIREQILQLVNEGLSPEKVVDKLSKDSNWKAIDVPDPRTIRNWLKDLKQKKEERTPEKVEQKRQHDIRIFTDSDNIMSEKDLHSFPLPILMPEIDNTKAVWYVAFPSQAEKISLNDAVTKMHQFMEFFSYESNKYFDSNLDSYSARLCEILSRITLQLSLIPDILESYEAAINHYREHMRKSEPVIIRKGELRYHPHKRLAVRYGRAIEAYQNYRVAVRESLLL